MASQTYLWPAAIGGLLAEGSPAESFPLHLRSLEITMSLSNFDSSRVGATVLRVSLGLMFIAHSIILKWLTFTLAGTAQYFESVHLPGFLAYVVFAAEATGGALLLAGIQTRIVALGLIPILVGALWVHSGNGWVFENAGGGWEYPLFLIVLNVVVALQAPVKSVARSFAKEAVAAH
jgi:putative oxidoreductase